MKNVLSEKYSADNIEMALKPWEYAKSTIPKLKSITSRFFRSPNNSTQPGLDDDDASNISTSFVLHKIYSLFGPVNLLQHYYLVIDGKVWHPGYVDEMQIFYDYETNDNNNIVKIEEWCHHCVYKNMKMRFEKDKKFHLITNNCQGITGHRVETLFTIIYHILLLLALIFGKFKILISAILIAISIFIYNRLQISNVEHSIYTCPHIRFD